MALSAHLFVISAAIAAAASAQELSGEICLYARTGNGTEVVFHSMPNLQQTENKTILPADVYQQRSEECTAAYLPRNKAASVIHSISYFMKMRSIFEHSN